MMMMTMKQVMTYGVESFFEGASVHPSPGDPSSYYSHNLMIIIIVKMMVKKMILMIKIL